MLFPFVQSLFVSVTTTRTPRMTVELVQQGRKSDMLGDILARIEVWRGV